MSKYNHSIVGWLCVMWTQPLPLKGDSNNQLFLTDYNRGVERRSLLAEIIGFIGGGEKYGMEGTPGCLQHSEAIPWMIDTSDLSCHGHD